MKHIYLGSQGLCLVSEDATYRMKVPATII